MLKVTPILISSLFAVFAFSAAPVAAKTNGVWTSPVDHVVEKRKKPRVNGGSGCDSIEDQLEHPECR